MGVKPWAVCSSSSGSLLSEIWPNLPLEMRSQCVGIFTDRDCGAAKVAQGLLPDKSHTFGRKRDFEKAFLKQITSFKSENGLVFLCGFFGILSEEFFQECPWPIVNTHPSLLPAFPGLDHKVHQEVFEQCAVSGFTLHMVNETLDGGPILYQAACDIADAKDWQEVRTRVKALEAAKLPAALNVLYSQDLCVEDRKVSTRMLLKKISL